MATVKPSSGPSARVSAMPAALSRRAALRLVAGRSTGAALTATALLSGSAWSMPADPGATDDDRLDQVFGRPAARGGLAGFARWRAVLQRHARRPWSGAERWLGQIRSWAALPSRVQLERVQQLIECARYASDEATWGVPDVWATPGEMLAYGGDCEDFALAKYLALRELGWPADRLRIVLLEDRSRQPPVDHAILLARLGGASNAGPAIALDRIGPLAAAADLPFFRPLFSLDERNLYVHSLR